jgi:hypothetical protein
MMPNAKVWRTLSDMIRWPLVYYGRILDERTHRIVLVHRRGLSTLDTAP